MLAPSVSSNPLQADVGLRPAGDLPRAAKRKALTSVCMRACWRWPVPAGIYAIPQQACRHSSIHACIHAACSPYACACKCVCACAYTHSSEEHQPETRRRPEVAGLDPRPRWSVLAPLVTLPADSPASTEAPCRRPRPSPAPAPSWRSCVASVAGAGAAPWPPCILPMARVL